MTFEDKKTDSNRLVSDSGLVLDGAEYKINPETGLAELIITDEQYEKAHQEMVSSIEGIGDETIEIISKLEKIDEEEAKEQLEARKSKLKVEFEEEVKRIELMEISFERRKLGTIIDLLSQGVDENSEEKILAGLNLLKEKFSISFEGNKLGKGLFLAWVAGKISVNSERVPIEDIANRELLSKERESFDPKRMLFIIKFFSDIPNTGWYGCTSISNSEKNLWLCSCGSGRTTYQKIFDSL